MSTTAPLHAFRLWLRLRLFHMPFTLLSAVVTIVLMTLVQSVERRPTFVTFTVAASIWAAAVLLETATVVIEEWQETVRFFLGTRRRGHATASSSAAAATSSSSSSTTLTTSPPRRSVLTNILAIFDLYIALCAAYTLIGMAPWLFDETPDKRLYYNGFEPVTGIQERDPWIVYFYFLVTSIMVYGGVGFAKIVPIVSWLAALFGTLSVIGYIYTVAIIGTVFGVFFVNIHDRRSDTHTHDFSDVPSNSSGGSGGGGGGGVNVADTYGGSPAYYDVERGVPLSLHGNGSDSMIIGHAPQQRYPQPFPPLATHGSPGTMSSTTSSSYYAGTRRSVYTC